jgi:hypothetical protein
VKTYTEQDVQRLVETAQWYERKLREEYKETKWYDGRLLRSALKPFLPDPEEQLIEKMARAINGSVQRCYAWDQLCEEGRNRWREDARAALAVVKREGLPK